MLWFCWWHALCKLVPWASYQCVFGCVSPAGYALQRPSHKRSSWTLWVSGSWVTAPAGALVHVPVERAKKNRFHHYSLAHKSFYQNLDRTQVSAILPLEKLKLMNIFCFACISFVPGLFMMCSGAHAICRKMKNKKWNDKWVCIKIDHWENSVFILSVVLLSLMFKP